MNKEEWAQILKEQIKFDHNYLPSFETTVGILSEILEERDRVYQIYLEKGAEPVTIFTTDRGAENYKPNPLLKTWQDLNVTALQYLRDLGLTPAGLRKLQGQLPKDFQIHNDKVASVLEELRGIADRKYKPTESDIMEGIRAKMKREAAEKAGT